MTKNGRLMAIILALSIVLSMSLSAQTPQAAPSQSEQMDRLFDFWNRLDQPGFAVVVVKEGKVV